MRKGFVFDLNKCVGCEACVVACQIENRAFQHGPWRSITTYNEFKHPALPLFHFSLACNHCDAPLCMTGCPANAFSIDPIHHTVDHNPDNCIGCRYCTWTCPYDAPKYFAANGTIEKCTMCKERIVAGGVPNCVNLCPTGALEFNDIDTKAAIDIPGFADKGIWPAIKFIPLRKKERPLGLSESLTESEHALFQKTRQMDPMKSTLKTEWPLIAFTLVAAFLCAVAAASLVNAPFLDPVAFIVLALGGMIVSALHLGKPLKAWRAVLNVRSSWLSREIVFYALFIAFFGTSRLISLPESFGLIGTFFGFAALVSIDMVYATVEGRSVPVGKGGSAILTGLLFFAVLAQLPIFTVAILVGYGVRYARELPNVRSRSLFRSIASAVRIAAGFVLPLVLISIHAEVWPLVISILIGETINRAEFYVDLDISSPRKQIERAVSLQLTSLMMEG
jgi:Fe-S-cluster-containing dehydrogenase component/DMSO reductase anchor subunit